MDKVHIWNGSIQKVEVVYLRCRDFNNYGWMSVDSFGLILTWRSDQDRFRPVAAPIVPRLLWLYTAVLHCSDIYKQGWDIKQLDFLRMSLKGFDLLLTILFSLAWRFIASFVIWERVMLRQALIEQRRLLESMVKLKKMWLDHMTSFQKVSLCFQSRSL